MHTTTWKRMTMMAAMAAAARAHNPAPNLTERVEICMRGQTAVEIAVAKARVVRMFGEIGVRIVWHDWTGCPADAIKISFSDKAENVSDTALGYALPYEGTHIVILIDRVRMMSRAERVPAILAHVMAHEITHILEGYSRHSESGLMKAHWSPSDIIAMSSLSGVGFAAEDVELIHGGLRRRERAAAAAAENAATAQLR